MKKKPVAVSVRELEEILERYLDAGSRINYALKILGHPGVGKSAVVKQVSESRNYLFIDTRLAFKENVDLGGYPVPDHDARRMVYFRPKFIPPETVPEGYKGVVWFLDESNRAHPTVIQTLFQIITERTCGEHRLPEGTSIVLAGNLGEEDSTTITEFDDSALDGRLAVIHLKPSADDWLLWAGRNDIHPSVIRYISLFPERLWDEEKINPNPRGWHQASLAIRESYGIEGDDDLCRYFSENIDGSLEKMLRSLVGDIAARDFIMQLTAPRALTTTDVLDGNGDKLEALKKGILPAEDILWALSGALSSLRVICLKSEGGLPDRDMDMLANLLRYIGYSRADSRLSFLYLLIRDCGIFSRIPDALKRVKDEASRRELLEKFNDIIMQDN